MHYSINDVLFLTCFLDTQGAKMGWLTAGGSLARMIGPVWATFAWHKGHSTLLFFGTAGIVTSALFIQLVFWRFLVPHPDSRL